MFARFILGKRANAYSSRAMERNTSSTMALRSDDVFSGYAISRLRTAVRRRRGRARSIALEHARAKPMGKCASNHITNLAKKYWMRFILSNRHPAQGLRRKRLRPVRG